MKRNLFLTLLACSAGVLLSAPGHAQTAGTTGTSSASATPAAPATPATPAATTPAAPDEDAGAHHRGAGILRHLTRELNLSGTQQAAVAQILEAAKPKMQAIREKAKADRDALVDSVSAQITPLLTPDQQTKFNELVQTFKNRHAMGEAGAKRQGGRYSPDAQLQRMTTTLGLSADQQSQIRPILEAARTQAKEIFANTSLSQEEKLTQFKQVLQGAHSQINGILTPAQQTQFAALKEKLHSRRKAGGEVPASPGVSGTTST
jgi:Spy/CpxP family protein refolding chaperone